MREGRYGEKLGESSIEAIRRKTNSVSFSSFKCDYFLIKYKVNMPFVRTYIPPEETSDTPRLFKMSDNEVCIVKYKKKNHSGQSAKIYLPIY